MLNYEPALEDYRPMPEYNYTGLQTGHQYIFNTPIGQGAFATVWRAVDVNTGSCVAIKAFRLGYHFTETAENEIDMLNLLKRYKAEHVVMMLDYFYVSDHVFIVLEYMDADLMDIISSFDGLKMPKPIIMRIIKHIQSGIIELHNSSIIHSDIKPENILVKCLFMSCVESVHIENWILERYPSKWVLYKKLCCKELLLMNSTFKVGDLGNAYYTDDACMKTIVSTLNYRAPEVILKLPHDHTIDMWALGCVIYEVLTGRLLFNPKKNADYNKRIHHLAQMIKLLGPIPPDMAVRKKYFDADGEFILNNRIGLHTPINWLLKHIYEYKEPDVGNYSRILEGLLCFDKSRRVWF